MHKRTRISAPMRLSSCHQLYAKKTKKSSGKKSLHKQKNTCYWTWVSPPAIDCMVYIGWNEGKGKRKKETKLPRALGAAKFFFCSLSRTPLGVAHDG